MNTDERLTQFRSDVPLPDEAIARRAYAQATKERSRLSRRRLAIAVVVAAACVAGGLFAALGGGTPKPPGAVGDVPFIAVENVSFTRDGQTVTSISFTLGDDLIPNAMLAIDVLRLDPTNPFPSAGPTGQEHTVNGTVVFDETVPMTNTGSTTPDTALSTWSGTLYPDDWDGGCQEGLYYVQATVYPAALSSDEPFDPGAMDRYHPLGVFRCRSS